MISRSLPSPQTKHLSIIDYPLTSNVSLSLGQSQSNSFATTGTTLWLSAQVLTAYLLDVYGKNPASNVGKRCIDLGSGIGLCGFTLAHLQYDVLMTDVPFILSSVLLPNIRRNTAALSAAPSGRLQARELDWTVPSSAWTWNSPSTTSITSDWTDPSRRPSEQEAEPVTPPFDLILTTDTIYVPELLDALLDTLRSLSLLSSSPPLILLALERRDSALVDASLAKARAGGFECGMVNKSRTARSVERHLAWEREDWDSVEIWKMRYKPCVCACACVVAVLKVMPHVGGCRIGMAASA